MGILSSNLAVRAMDAAACAEVAQWPKDEKFICKECGDPARVEGKEPFRWACERCKLRTRNPGTLFQSALEQKVA